MAWIDYRKAYGTVPHSWNVQKLIAMTKNIVTLVENCIANWKTVLESNQDILGTVDIKRGIFQGDSLSPLLFVIIIRYHCH